MHNPFSPPKSRLSRQAGAAALMIVLLALLSGAWMGKTAPARAERLYQDPTAYPGEETLPPVASPTLGGEYPADTPPPNISATPSPTLDPSQPTQPTQATQTTPFAPDDTPQPAMSVTSMATDGPNTFLTEDAEMGAGNVTPPPSETPGPTITAYRSATPKTATARPARTAIARRANDDKVNWGLFWIGFSIPVLSACGVVLYLLDQRPDLFRPRKK